MSIGLILFGISLLVSLLVFYKASPDFFRQIKRKTDERWFLGLPIGSIFLICLILSFYLFIQRGLQRPNNPLIIPFFSWSYFYPEGIFLSPIAHFDIEHLISNITAVTILAPITEYIFNSKDKNSITAIISFIFIWYIVGFFISAFSWGPTIGFSGVVFGLLGFVVVFYPIKSILLSVFIEVFEIIILGIYSPTVYGFTPPRHPWWVGIAVQAHVVGFLIGIFFGVYIAKKRKKDINSLKIGVVAIILGIFYGLYAVWNLEEYYVLYRALGLSLVIFGGILIWFFIKEFSKEKFDIKAGFSLAIFLLPFFIICFVGGALNLGYVTEEEIGEGKNIQDYTIWYTEKQENGLLDIPFISTKTNLTGEGIIVGNTERQIWLEKISQEQLTRQTELEFYVGDITWEEKVKVERKYLTVPGEGSVYSILVNGKPIFDSSLLETDTTVKGWNINFKPYNEDIFIILTKKNNTKIFPLKRQKIKFNGVTIDVRDKKVLASFNDTEFLIGRLSYSYSNTY